MAARILGVVVGVALAGSGAVLCLASDEAAREASGLAGQARAILERSCADCHAHGSAEGEIDFVLNRRRLVQRGVVTPGDPSGSKLYRQVKSGAMPKDADPLSADDLALLERWIKEGAADWEKAETREPIGPLEVLAAIADDLRSIERRKPRDLLYTRYFTITHLYNAGYSDDELQTYRLALNKLVNSLSWGRKIVNPEPIDPPQTIFRIDLRNYRWTRDTWDRILEINPYGVEYDTPAAELCAEATGCEFPYVRGDWFVATAATPPLYHEILDLPDTDGELEALLHIDVAANLASDQAARAGFNGSGVSNNNRLIERHISDFTQGAYWKSYDFQPLREEQDDGDATTHPERNLFQRPLGPRSVMPAVRDVFVHAGGELIWNLPNGLQAYMLIDEQGQRIDAGPIDIVSDPGRPDRTVVNGLSCMSCHTRGMKEKADQVRQTVLSNPEAYSDEEIELVKALYPPAEEFQALLDEDARRFAQAVEQTRGKVSDTDPVVVLAQRFESELDATLAAAEIGVTPDELLNAIRQSRDLARILGPLRVAGGTIKRDQLLSAFARAVKMLKVGESASSTSDLAATTNRLPATGVEELVVKGIGMRMRLLPAGQFLMGSPESETDRFIDELQHAVRITRPFYLGVFEVTQDEFQRVMKYNPSHFRPDGEGSEPLDATLDTGRFPVEQVSWFDAVEFCNRLSQREGLAPFYELRDVQRHRDGSIETASVAVVGGDGYRLPTEAEWEYACRAGATTPFHFGSRLNGEDANVDGDYPYGAATAGPNLNRTTTVGSYLPNDFGLFDMHGNVAEWCQDVYAKTYYQDSPAEDPTGPDDFAADAPRVQRGGAWSVVPSGARAADRADAAPTFRIHSRGFRVARSF